MDDFVPEFDEAANLVRECGGLVFIPHIFEYRENSEKILDYMISRKKKKLQQLEMQCIQDNYKLVMLQSENSKRQQS